MASESINTRQILREGEVVDHYRGPFTLRAPREHLEKFLEERISAGRRLLLTRIQTEFHWTDAQKRLRLWNAFNQSELDRLFLSEEPRTLYREAATQPDPASTAEVRDAAFREAVNAPLGFLVSLYARLQN